jgi:YD repeat-containing protein
MKPDSASCRRFHLRRPPAPGSPSPWMFLHITLLALLAFSRPCFGQRQIEPRPAPLNPVEAERQARALVAEMLAEKPEQNSTNTGWVRIWDAEDKEHQIPVRFETIVTPSNWLNVYETLPSASGPGREKLTVIHTDEQPNRYELTEPAAAGATNVVPKELTPAQSMVPFADSDFWIADLGLEFLHWPKQRLLEKEMRHSKFCDVLESVNPAPAPGGYSRVVAWIMIESPHGIVHADAYDAQGKLLKRFDPTALEKVQGQYQVEAMEIRNLKTGSRTVIKMDLDRE